MKEGVLVETANIWRKGGEIRVGGEGVIRECCMKEGLVAIMVHRKRPWNIEGV